MATIPAICSECGAHLTLDHKGARCPFCGTPIVMERSESYELSIRDTLTEDGEAFLELGDWDSAGNSFSRLIKDYPYDFRGWWGMVRVVSQDFTITSPSRAEYADICNYAERAWDTAAPKEQEEIRKIMSAYTERLVSRDTVLLKTAVHREEKQELSEDKRALQESIAELGKKIDRVKQAPRVAALVVGTIAVLSAIIAMISLVLGGTFAVWEAILLSLLLIVCAYLLAFCVYLVVKLITDSILLKYKRIRKRLVRDLEAKS